MRTTGQGQASRSGGEGVPPKGKVRACAPLSGTRENIFRTVTAVERYPNVSFSPEKAHRAYHGRFRRSMVFFCANWGGCPEEIFGGKTK